MRSNLFMYIYQDLAKQWTNRLAEELANFTPNDHKLQ